MGLFLLVLALPRTSGAVEPDRRFVDFLYADANEGSASGGHVALRLEDRTYHFGYQDPGVLRLDRDDSDRFAHVYGSLENRNVQALRVEVAPDTFDRLRASFNERYLSESVEFDVLAGLRRDREFLEGWERGPPDVRVRAAGYFVDPAGARSGADDAALARLGARIRERYGVDFVSGRSAEAAAILRALPGEAALATPSLAEPGRHPVGGYGVRGRAADARALVEALRILETRRSLRPESVVTLSPADFPLDRDTRQTLRGVADRLESDLVDVVGSTREDVGFALLVGMARLLALETTRDEGRLVVLDVFPDDPSRLAVAEIESRGGDLGPLETELRSELLRVREVLNARAALRESDYGALEAVANRYREIERSRATRQDLRFAREHLLPVRSAQLGLVGWGAPPAADLRRRIEELRSLESAQLERLDGDHHYNLLAHNCVSELFVQVERAVADGTLSAPDASTVQLGGHVPPGRGFEFIPFLAADAVHSSYRVGEVVTTPSYRSRKVAEMTDREGLPAALRESNVFTSTVYERNSLDSAFLFFTDDTVVARPLLGFANLLYGVGATVVGLSVAPFDAGRLLSAGLRGTMWSVPELAFVNVRKGSFFHVPREEPAP